MLRLGKESKATPAQVLAKAKAYFAGPHWGLEIGQETAAGVTFIGGGGHVTVEAAPEAAGSRVEIISREWDYAAKEFLAQI